MPYVQPVDRPMQSAAAKAHVGAVSPEKSETRRLSLSAWDAFLTHMCNRDSNFSPVTDPINTNGCQLQPIDCQDQRCMHSGWELGRISKCPGQ